MSGSSWAVDRASTILYCLHWAETVAFYRTRIGLRAVMENEWFVEFELTATSFLAVADAARATIDPVGGQGITLAWRVDDLDVVEGLLRERGVPTTGRRRRWGSDVLYCHDPEGHRIEFWTDTRVDSGA